MNEEKNEEKEQENNDLDDFLQKKIKEEIILLRKTEQELQDSYNKWKEKAKIFTNHFGIYHSSLNQAIYVNGEVYKELVWTEEWLDKVKEQSLEKEIFINNYFNILKDEIQNNKH